MITIHNTTPPRELSSEWHTYQITAARQVLGNFQHRPADGIAKCLLRASAAMSVINGLEAYSRFPDEKIQNPKEVPDEADGLRCEEILHAEAQAAEADLEEKDGLAGAISSLEGEPGHKAVVLAMWLGDRDRAQRELASSLREANASNLVVRDPGLRPLP